MMRYKTSGHYQIWPLRIWEKSFKKGELHLYFQCKTFASLTVLELCNLDDLKSVEFEEALPKLLLLQIEDCCPKFSGLPFLSKPEGSFDQGSRLHIFGGVLEGAQKYGELIRGRVVILEGTTYQETQIQGRLAGGSNSEDELNVIFVLSNLLAQLGRHPEKVTLRWTERHLRVE